MLSSKQRATLRSMANGIDTIMQVGKDGITDNLVTTVSDALEARELIKLKVLDNSAETPRSAAEALAQATGADSISLMCLTENVRWKSIQTFLKLLELLSMI